MTIVRVRYTPPGGPVPGFIRARPQHDEDNRPLVVGRDIISGDTGWLEVPVEGMELDLRPSEPGWHYAIQGKAEGAPSFSVTKLVPQTGPVDFGDLVDYNPKAGMAYEPDPPWYAHLNSLETGLQGTQADLHAARDLAVTSANGAATSASTALGASNSAEAHALAAQQARDESVALGISVDTSAGTRVFVGETMIHGDTGWRNISGLLINGWTVSRMSIRRYGDTVCLQLNGLNKSEATSDNFLAGIQGFAPHLGELWLPWGEEAVNVILRYQNQHLQRANRGNARINGYGTFNWVTAQAWPSTLPGTPA